ncbi:MAG: adenylate kinase [Alphaproteobacteria bacterium]
MVEKNCRHIVMLGPPGGGKGTQAAILSEKLGINTVSTGAVLRKIADSGTKEGDKIKALLNKGRMVSDKLMIKIMKDVLSEPENVKGYILDGSPRSVPQAKGLDCLLSSRHMRKLGQTLDAVLYLQVPDDYVIERIIGRFQCAHCKALYHERFKPTKVFGICDVCGHKEFTRREDDTFETVVSRLRAFREVTAPLIPYYEKKGLLKCIDGTGPIDVVSEKIRKIVGY